MDRSKTETIVKNRRPGGGRKRKKPDYDADRILQQKIEQAVQLYGTGDRHTSLQRIADEMELNPIKVRKLLITAGVYESKAADMVQQKFAEHLAAGASHKEAIALTAQDTALSPSSVASYLPYDKCVYFPPETDTANLSTGAERQRRYIAVKRLLQDPDEETLWNCVVAFQGYQFKTLSDLPFFYRLKKGREGAYTRELWVNRRENSKSLTWSSLMRAFNNIPQMGALVERPKALGNIRGVSYFYAMFCRFGLIKSREN